MSAEEIRRLMVGNGLQELRLNADKVMLIQPVWDGVFEAERAGLLETGNGGKEWDQRSSVMA